MFGISLITWIVFALIFASLSSTIAEDKGHGEFAWGSVNFSRAELNFKQEVILR